MQIHQVRPKNRLKSEKRVGRGGKRGAYSGRGVKGQLSRAGHKKAPVIREIIKKYHKLRGYRFNPISEKAEIVKISDLQKNFKSNDTVSPKTLVDKKVLRSKKGKFPLVKILANGSIDKPLTVEGCLLSKLAVNKIEKAGGKVMKNDD